MEREMFVEQFKCPDSGGNPIALRVGHVRE